MKSLLAFWFVVAYTCILSNGIAAEFSPALDYELNFAKSDQKVSAIVILESPVDIRTLDFRLHDSGADIAQRNLEVLAALHYNAESTQPAFEAELRQAMSQKHVEGYTAYWIENLFVVYASKEWLESLRDRTDVKYVTENFRAELIEPIMDDESDNRPPRNPLDTETTTPGQNAIGATRVNRELGITGQGVLVANCDTGVDGNHPALASRWRGNFAPLAECWHDALGNAPNFPSDLNNHGTHVMGTITGRAISGVDTITVGSAPNARWIADNSINQGVSGAFNNDVIAAFQWFANPDGNVGTIEDLPDVIQNSWGVFTGLGYAQCFDLWNTVILNCEAAGPVITWSAGNESTNGLRSPAIYSINAYQIFSVGAVDATNFAPPYPLASFSSRGPTPCAPAVPDNIKPEISAPGVNVYSSIPGGGYTNGFSGTSMAGPHVAGVVALMREACPNCDHITIKDAIIATATDLGAVGQDNLFGHGLINAYEAVLAVGNVARIAGLVTDAATFAPLSSIAIRVLGQTQSTTTNFNGEYMLTVPSGTYSIEFSKFGYVTDTVANVVAVEGDTLILHHAMNASPAGIVSGIVTSCNGGPSVGAIVSIIGFPIPADTTDASGFYQIALPQGVYSMTASGATCSPVTVNNVAIGASTTVNLTLLPHPSFLCSSVDAAGYFACENGDPDGPTMSWLEIAPAGGGAGTLTGLVTDNAAVQIALPITFRFYGVDYSSVRVSTNGLLTFVTSVTSGVNAQLPTATFGPGIVPFWDDLNPALGGQICTYYNATDHAFIVEWYRVPHVGAPAALETFQVWLYDINTNPGPNGSSQIRMQYLDMTNTASATVGIQNLPSANAYGFNNVYVSSAQGLADGRVITYGGSVAPLLGSITGIVSDSVTQAPIVGAIVHRSGNIQSFVTDINGQYSMDALVGTYDLLVTSPDYLDRSVQGVVVTENQTTTVDFELLSKPRIVGTVTDSVTLMPLEFVDVFWIEGGIFARTDSIGHYEFVADTGVQTLSFSRFDYVAKSVQTASLAGGQVLIQDIELLSLPRVVGTITDSTTGLPVSFADVQWLEGGGFVNSDEFGNYEIVADAGVQTLIFSRWDYEPLEIITVPLQGGQTHTLNITLVPFPRIVGTVTDSTTGRPLRNVEVQWLEGGGFAYTDWAGYYEMIVFEGVQTLTYFKDGYGTAEIQTSSIGRGERYVQDVELSALSYFLFLEEHFDEGAFDWTHIGEPNWEDNWHISTERSLSTPSSYKCGDTGTGNYSNQHDARLMSPVIFDLLPGATMSFSMQMDTRLNNSAPDSAFDGGVIEISADGGAWEIVEPIQGYNKIFPYEDAPGDPFTGPLPGVQCLGGTFSTWTNYDVDLSNYAGQSVQVAFRFCSNDNSTREGWYIDDVLIQTNQTTPNAPNELTINYNYDTDEIEFRWQNTGGPVFELYSSSSSDGPFVTFEGSTLDNFMSLPMPESSLKFYIVIASNDFSILDRDPNAR